MQHRIVTLNMQNLQASAKQNMFMISKKRSKNMTKYAEKMQYRHPPIQEHVVYSHLDFIFLYI